MLQRTTEVKIETFEEKVKTVAEAIRDEINSAPSIFKQWPPTEEDLLKAEIVVPKKLKHFLSKLLSKKV